MADVTSITVTADNSVYSYGDTPVVYWTCSPVAVVGSEFAIWLRNDSGWYIGHIVAADGSGSYSHSVPLSTKDICSANTWIVGWRAVAGTGSFVVTGQSTGGFSVLQSVTTAAVSNVAFTSASCGGTVSAGAVLRTNYALNPASVGTKWGTDSAGIAFTVETSPPVALPSGLTSCTKAVHTSGSWPAKTLVGTFAVAAGEVYTASWYCHVAALAGTEGVYLYFETYTGATRIRTFVAYAEVAAVNASFARVQVPPLTIAAGEDGLRLTFCFRDGTSTSYLTGCLLEKAAAAGDYFDGTSDGAYWTGAANASTSVFDGITSRGVCWNATGTPTTADSKTNDHVHTATNAGAFTSAIVGLSPGPFHTRAYAASSVGTAYGTEVDFKAGGQPGTVPGAVLELHAARAIGGFQPGTNVGSPAQWFDTSGNGNHGALTNFDFDASSGWAGAGTAADPYCINPNGANGSDYIPYRTQSWGGEVALTCEFWFCSTEDTPAGNRSIVIAESGGGGFYIYRPGGSNSLTIRVRADSGVKYYGFSPALTIGEWHHWAATISATTCIFYFDGAQYGLTRTDTYLRQTSCTYDLFNNSLVTLSGKGAIVRHYPFALTPAQVAQNYAAGTTWPTAAPLIQSGIFF